MIEALDCSWYRLVWKVGNRGVPLDVGLNEVKLCLACELVGIGTGEIVDGGGKRVLEWCQT